MATTILATAVCSQPKVAVLELAEIRLTSALVFEEVVATTDHLSASFASERLLDEMRPFVPLE